ncbi:hypothetical protein K501DRAFT_144630, partial [Backusella circina FSU 941]
MSFIFLHEHGNRNIYDENRNEAMDIVEESEEFNIKQLITYDSYMEENVNNSSLAGSNNDETEMKKKRAKNYNDYSDKERKMFFEYKLQHLMSTRGAAQRARIKPSTAKDWWDTYLENPDEYVIGKKTNRQNRKPLTLGDEHKE